MRQGKTDLPKPINPSVFIKSKNLQYNAGVRILKDIYGVGFRYNLLINA